MTRLKNIGLATLGYYGLLAALLLLFLAILPIPIALLLESAVFVLCVRFSRSQENKHLQTWEGNYWHWRLSRYLARETFLYGVWLILWFAHKPTIAMAIAWGGLWLIVQPYYFYADRITVAKKDLLMDLGNNGHREEKSINYKGQILTRKEQLAEVAKESIIGKELIRTHLTLMKSFGKKPRAAGW